MRTAARVELKRVRDALWGVAFLGLIAGCVSAPDYRYHTLDMTPSGGARPQRYAVEVGRLRLSEALAPQSILIKLSPTEAEYYAYHLWLGTLEEQIHEKLEAEFGPAAPGRPKVIVSGSVLAFEQIDTPEGADAHVKLDITLRFESADPYGETALEKRYDARLPAEAAGPGEVVKALSHAVEKIAGEVAGDVDRLDPPP